MTRDVVRVSTGMSLSFFAELQALVWDMRWLILLCVALIIVDLRFGIENAQVHGETIRRSRAIRRTVNKFIDYLCWLLFAGIFGMAFAKHFGWNTMLVVDMVMIVACLAEIDSILQNYAQARGIEGFSLRALIAAIIRGKNKALGDVIDNVAKKDKEK